MKEVLPNLYVGNDIDWDMQVKGLPNWAVVHCAKEPYHRAALGYTTPGAPKSHPDYYYIRQGQELTLNMVDAKDPKFISLDMMKAAIAFIHSELVRKRKVLVHCNQGHSRGPTTALLYMARGLPDNFKAAQKAFRQKYALYTPAMGCEEFARQNWLYFHGLR